MHIFLREKTQKRNRFILEKVIYLISDVSMDAVIFFKKINLNEKAQIEYGFFNLQEVCSQVFIG